MTRPSYETWLRDTRCIGINGDTIFIETPNGFVAETLEQRMYSLISSELREILGQEIEIEFVVPEESPNGPVQSTG